jgi:hypothetical protein
MILLTTLPSKSDLIRAIELRIQVWHAHGVSRTRSRKLIPLPSMRNRPTDLSIRLLPWARFVLAPAAPSLARTI